MGGMGGMGGMYGGGMYGGGGYGGMGGYGGGMYGAGPGMYGPNGEQSLTQTFSNSTQATFQMIESIVGAFGGFAQMLESTYMATHSSFFAMVSVAEQLGTLRQTMGSILGIFALMRWFRAAVAKLTGRPPPASSTDLTVANFAAFTGAPSPDGAPAKPSRKPFIFFVLAVFGLPYLMGKLIKSLASSQEAEQQRQLAAGAAGLDGQPQSIDPSKLDFCRVLYDYAPQAQPGQQFQEGVDIVVKKGDLVAVLSKTDPAGQPSDWWRCRARDGGVGYLPSPYLETIQRRPQAQIAAHAAPLSEPNSRVNTMTASTFDVTRANSLKVPAKEKVEVMKPSKPLPEAAHGGDLPATVEHFQRGGFYS
jgi:peroxin-13